MNPDLSSLQALFNTPMPVQQPLNPAGMFSAPWGNMTYQPPTGMQNYQTLPFATMNPAQQMPFMSPLILASSMMNYVPPQIPNMSQGNSQIPRFSLPPTPPPSTPPSPNPSYQNNKWGAAGLFGPAGLNVSGRYAAG